MLNSFIAIIPFGRAILPFDIAGFLFLLLCKPTV
jgi:hypothetical protein